MGLLATTRMKHRGPICSVGTAGRTAQFAHKSRKKLEKRNDLSIWTQICIVVCYGKERARDIPGKLKAQCVCESTNWCLWDAATCRVLGLVPGGGSRMIWLECGVCGAGDNWSEDGEVNCTTGNRFFWNWRKSLPKRVQEKPLKVFKQISVEVQFNSNWEKSLWADTEWFMGYIVKQKKKKVQKTVLSVIKKGK